MEDVQLRLVPAVVVAVFCILQNSIQCTKLANSFWCFKQCIRPNWTLSKARDIELDERNTQLPFLQYAAGENSHFS